MKHFWGAAWGVALILAVSLCYAEPPRFAQYSARGAMSPSPERAVTTGAAQAAGAAQSTQKRDVKTRGILALSFDDGYPNWIRIAQILKKHNGFATGYVNNWKLDRGEISPEMLTTLQDLYGWEIGTHTYSHANAYVFAMLNGQDAWVQNELVRSITQLSQYKLRIQSLVFPYNRASDKLRQAALAHVSSFRDAANQPIGEGIRQDGTFAGRALDIGNYVPLEVILSWIDEAYREEKVLLIYGHQVLPDSEFREGTVQAVASGELVTTKPITGLNERYICLVPDIKKTLQSSILIVKIDGSRLVVSNGDLTRMTAPGARFLVGPCMGLRESDFEVIAAYAAERLQFRRISDLPRLR